MIIIVFIYVIFVFCRKMSLPHSPAYSFHHGNIFRHDTGVSVKDLGHYTTRTSPPYALLMPLCDVLAIIRHYWVYEKVSEYTKDAVSYTIIKIRSKTNRKAVVRMVWENSAGQSASRASVVTERAWKESTFGGRSKVMDTLSDVDILQEQGGRMLAFG